MFSQSLGPSFYRGSTVLNFIYLFFFKKWIDEKENDKVEKNQELKREIARTVDVELMRTVRVIPIAGCRIIGK